MAGYSTKQHSESLKALGTQIDTIKEDKAKELIYSLVRPIKRMNDEIYGMASDFSGFIDDPASNAVLCQIQSLNAQILEILNQRDFPTPIPQSTDTDSKEAPPSSSATAAAAEEVMPLSDLIRILTPSQYNESLLSALFDKHAITTQTVLRADLRDTVLATLKECAFSQTEAESLLSQLGQNLGTSPAQTNASAPAQSNSQATQSTTEPTDDFGIKVVDLTMTAILGVFEGEVSVNRSEIGRIYGAHKIDTVQLSSMTEHRFTELLRACTVRGGAHSQFSRPQCIKIHRAIKTLLNAPQSDRYDIAVGEAVLYLLANNEALKKKQLTIDATQIRAAFEECSARRVMEDGKKAFLQRLREASNGEIKVGYGTKLWNGFKEWVEDSNARVPEEVVIKDFQDEVHVDDVDEEKAMDGGDNDDADDAKEVEVEAPKVTAGDESLG